MLEKLLIISLFTMVIQSIETLSYAVRLAGVRTGKLAIGFSLFNMLIIVSRTANLVQAPLTASLVDAAKISGDFGAVEHQIRAVLGAASAGTVFGLLATPTFVALFSMAILAMQKSGSVPGMAKAALSPANIAAGFRAATFAGLFAFAKKEGGAVPWKLLALNVFATAFYTTGVLASLYASLIAPAYSSIALMSSGMVNGFAMIAFAVFVDPKVAWLTDQVAKGERSQAEMEKVVGLLGVSRFAGTLAAQALLIPAAMFVAWLCPIFF